MAARASPAAWSAWSAPPVSRWSVQGRLTGLNVGVNECRVALDIGGKLGVQRPKIRVIMYWNVNTPLGGGGSPALQLTVVVVGQLQERELYEDEQGRRQPP